MKKIITLLSLFVLTPTSVYAFTVSPPSVGPGAIDIGNLISAVIGIMIVIAAVLALLYLILGGIQWITSGGDKQGLEGARNKITAAIVGLIIVAATWAIMTLVGNFIGFNILNGKDIQIPTIQNPNGGTNCPAGEVLTNGTCVRPQ